MAGDQVMDSEEQELQSLQSAQGDESEIIVESSQDTTNINDNSRLPSPSSLSSQPTKPSQTNINYKAIHQTLLHLVLIYCTILVTHNTLSKAENNCTCTYHNTINHTNYTK